jgi:hypothetical protein
MEFQIRETIGDKILKGWGKKFAEENLEMNVGRPVK